MLFIQSTFVTLSETTWLWPCACGISCAWAEHKCDSKCNMNCNVGQAASCTQAFYLICVMSDAMLLSFGSTHTCTPVHPPFSPLPPTPPPPLRPLLPSPPTTDPTERMLQHWYMLKHYRKSPHSVSSFAQRTCACSCDNPQQEICKGMCICLHKPDVHPTIHAKKANSLIQVRLHAEARCCFTAAIPSLVVAAASFDDMIAITGYTIFIDIAVRRNTGNQTWQIMHGPVSVVLGVLGGLVAAFLCSFTKLWNNNVKRICVVLFAGLCPLCRFVPIVFAGLCPSSLQVCATCRTCACQLQMSCHVMSCRTMHAVQCEAACTAVLYSLNHPALTITTCLIVKAAFLIAELSAFFCRVTLSFCMTCCGL